MTAQQGTDEYAGMAALYDALLEPFLRRGRLAQVALAKELGARRVLDMGCGTGKQISRFAGSDVQVYGLDLSPGMLAQAREQAAGRCVQADATQAPFADKSFDLVYCQYALHEKSREVIGGLLAEARRVLRPQGFLAVTDYAPQADRRPWTQILGLGIRIIERIAGDAHYRHFCDWMQRGGLAKVLDEAGWEQQKATHIFRGNVRMILFKPRPAPRTSA